MLSIQKVAASRYRIHLFAAMALALLIGALLRLPGIPYNISELLAPGNRGIWSILGLTVTAYSMVNGAFLFFGKDRRTWILAFPAILLIHGVLTWWILRYSVPIESMLDIVGSPVLDWPWEWEMLGRYLALHMALMLQLLGATLCVRAILQLTTLADFLYWIVISVLLAWPLYVVLVQWAATDNLTELIASDASFLACSALALAFFLTCFAAGAVSAAIGCRYRFKTLILLASGAVVGAIALYWLGFERTIVKYGHAFSAFQFLLSTDRAHYLHGADLALRFGAALFCVLISLAIIQHASWRFFLRESDTGRR